MNKGFTLIEIIITIVVLAIVSLFTFSFITASVKTYQMIKTQNGLYFEAAYALERISRELNDATYVISSSSNSIVFQKVNYSTTIDNRQFVDYRLNGADIIRASSTVSPPGVGQVIASNASVFSITSAGTLENTSYNIAITLSRDSQTVTLSTAVCPKNYCASAVDNGTGATCAIATNRLGRSFNRDYYDVIQ
jgi:prepilin-type N-terminal cleavage/methylation domain-containing protein